MVQFLSDDEKKLWDCIVFAFLHSMVSVVMLTLIYKENKIEKEKIDLKKEKA